MGVELSSLSIGMASRALQQGELTPESLVDAAVAAIEDRNEALNALVEVFYDDLDVQLEHARALRKAGRATPLTGIPVVIKDNLLWEGHLVTAASRVLEGYRASYTATAVQRLLDAGVIIVGRANMDEFAMGSSTEHSMYGPTRNPHDPTRVAGGSSGGSAAAVAAGMALAALGSDTGGSVRQPAAFCGVVGFKPTYGAIPRHGLIAMGSSLDVVGTITVSAEDALLLLEHLAGEDGYDATALPSSALVPPPTEGESLPVYGIVREVEEVPGVAEEVVAAYREARDALVAAGAEVREVSIPHLRAALATYYLIMPAEASTNLARYDGIRYGPRERGEGVMGATCATRGRFGREVKRRILLGTFVLSAGYRDAFYRTARRARQLIRDEFARAFVGVDALVLPTTPGPAFSLGQKVNDPLAMYAEDIFTVPANIVGAPAVSIPLPRPSGALPLGIQLVAPPRHDKPLLRHASWCARALAAAGTTTL